MTEQQFLKSTLRQLNILEDLHSNYFKNNLMQVAISILGSEEESEGVVYVESLGDMFG